MLTKLDRPPSLIHAVVRVLVLRRRDLHLRPTLVQKMTEAGYAEVANRVLCRALCDGAHDGLHHAFSLKSLFSRVSAKSNPLRIRVLASEAVSHHPRTASKSARPLTHISPTSTGTFISILLSSSGVEIDIDGDASPRADSSRSGFSVGDICGLPSSCRRRKETYAFTNAEGLNLGRHMGSQEADAEELMIDGE